jgi:hypothetical protein
MLLSRMRLWSGFFGPACGQCLSLDVDGNAAKRGHPMFTLEINGRPVAVADGNEDQARQVFGGETFKNDLRSMKANGRPLWDGSTHFNIRPATDPEVEAYRQAADDELADDNDDDRDGAIRVMFMANPPLA